MVSPEYNSVGADWGHAAYCSDKSNCIACEQFDSDIYRLKVGLHQKNVASQLIKNLMNLVAVESY